MVCAKCGRKYSDRIFGWPMIFVMIVGKPLSILHKYGLSLYEYRPDVLKSDRKRHRLFGKLAAKRRLRFLKHKWFCGQKGKLEVIPRLMNESEWAEWARNGSQRVYDEDGDPDGFIIRDGKVYH